MGEFDEVYCFGNSPYECEFVLDMAGIDTSMGGNFKCQACNLEGEFVSSIDTRFVRGLLRGARYNARLGV